ncbi:MAG: YbfB/YjiJ family MFS transporter [Verrucomicrobia bacterium]|nr:YbfB/YjiJ family MFS transporter [Verrucomicrobiota bacterium]
MRSERTSPRLHYSFIALGAIVVAIFIALGLGRHGYTSVLPAMQDSLKLSNSQTGELQSWNLVGYLLTVVFAGLLASHYGPRRVIAVSLFVAAAAMLVTGLVPTFNGARLGRFLAGVGGAGANVPAMALVSAWFGASRRGLASGAAVAGSSVGLIVTGPLVPWVLDRSGPGGWPVCWFVFAAMALVACLVCAVLLRNRPEEVGVVPLGESAVEHRARTEDQHRAALGWSQVWRSGTLWHVAAIYAAFGFSYIIYSTFFIRHLMKEAGFTKTDAGLLWLKVGMVSVISGFIWGGVSDRWGRRVALVCVFVLQGVSFAAFGLSQKLGIIYFSAGLFALTAWSIPALVAAQCGDVFGPRLAPAALGLVTIVFGIGQAFGPYFAGRIADATKSFSPAFLTAGLVALVLGAGGSWLLRGPARKT